MNGQGETRRINLSLLEKGVISLFGAITFAMLSWVTVTTNTTATEVAVMKTSIEFIQRDSEKAGADRFTGNQGREHERRITENENAIAELERRR